MLSDTHPELRQASAPASGLGEPLLAQRAQALKAYSPGVLPNGAKVDLWLDANEGPASLWENAPAVAQSEELLRRYPSAAALEAMLAASWGVAASQIIVTAGGDDAIDRVCRAVLNPGDELIFPAPSFEMIERFARLAGASVARVEWGREEFPVERVLAAATERTRLVSLVTPNNPTGSVISIDAIHAVAKALPQAWIMVDLAYAEFADSDPMREVLSLPNVVVIRTFSKAYAMAGARVGYSVGPERLINALRAVGGPFAVSGPSAALVAARLEVSRAAVAERIEAVRAERDRLVAQLASLGAKPFASQGNFVLAEFRDAAQANWVWRALLSLGILVRRFGDTYAAPLPKCLRITCPGDESAFARVTAALSAVFKPDAILLDMDGVIADVSGSYRAAVSQTAATFGVTLSPADIQTEKDLGDANNDWIVTHRLLTKRGVTTSLAEVTRRFEALYWGMPGGTPGLVSQEALISSLALLEALRAKARLAIVTGRPRRDAEVFLDRFGIRGFFETIVCMEDAPRKPDPAPVRLAMQQLGVRSAWMVGDTPDDLVAARGAGVVPLAIPAPGAEFAVHTQTLEAAGAARVLSSLEQLLEMLP
ncbi:MAG: TIGR01548 family HAD-type hydrolase [Phycisphaerales bacterium]